MPRVDLTLESNIERTPRVVQLEGMFDVPSAEKTRVEFAFDVPLDERSWNVGLIVGPSGAGKSSVARHLFGDAMVSGYDWHPTRSVVDGFGDLPIRDITGALSSVGFSSPPNWLRPFHVLSNGEQFRATMARALVDPRPVVCVDEFTSVVDRNAAQIGSHAMAKSVRARDRKLVAVTCHYDVLEWLQPDWVLEPHLGRFGWRSLQRRPSIDLEIRRVHHGAWQLFRAHHYLTGDILRSAACFVATWKGVPVAFDAWAPFIGYAKEPIKRGHRTVCLPDFQGAGIGNAVVDLMASAYKALGFSPRDTTSHPAMLHHRGKSSAWRLMRHGFSVPDRSGTTIAKRLMRTRGTRRVTATYEYVGPAMDREQARALVRTVSP